MRAQKSKSESGQILVLLAVGFVALLAFVALAIDGGSVFLDRRSAQNAADAAALAGAYDLARDPLVSISKIKNDAATRAKDNHYSAIVDYPVDTATIHIVSSDTDPTHYVRVTITSTVNTSFLHFVFPGLVKNTVEAVAHVIPSTPGAPYNGNALVALAPHECPSLTVGGNGNTILSGGGIFVNSDCASAVDGGSGSFQINTPSMTVVGGISITHPENLIVPSGALIQNATNASVDYPPNNSMFPPVPTCLPDAIKNIKDPKPVVDGITYDEYSPGNMKNGFPAGNIYFDPGVYCITINKNGPGVSINGGQYLYNDPPNPQNSTNGVLLVITGNDPCNLFIDGGATLNLTSYNGFYNGFDYTGFLFYFDPTLLHSTTSMLTLNGNSASSIKGEIYAPTCSIKYAGNSGNSYTGQVIGYDYTLVGGAEINIGFIEGEAPPVSLPAKVDLSQ